MVHVVTVCLRTNREMRRGVAVDADSWNSAVAIVRQSLDPQWVIPAGYGMTSSDATPER
jgi:hypothetical protein